MINKFHYMVCHIDFIEWLPFPRFLQETIITTFNSNQDILVIISVIIFIMETMEIMGTITIINIELQHNMTKCLKQV